jgi:aspartyl protease family protein
MRADPAIARRIRFAFGAAALVIAAGPASVSAQSVTLSGSLGADKALLVIDGHPQALAVGSSARGVTLRRIDGGQAEIEIGGKLLQLRIGDGPARLTGEAVGVTRGNEIVLPADSGGHFFATGAVNGRSARFVVDTGATLVAISEREADRLGLVEWRNGPRAMTATAGGGVVAHGLTLHSLRIGDVEVFDVAALVVPADMPVILLGNSFLTRFSMRRDNDTMRLERRR